MVPHLADGGGWKSLLMVTNVSRTASSCTLQLFGLDMSRFEDAEGVTVADSAASFELEGAGGYLVWSTRGEGPEVSGYATLDCANSVVAQVVFASIGSSGAPTGMATVFSSQAATVFQFPVLMPEATLGFAIANNGNAETSCRIVLEDRQRTNLGEATVSVPAKSNRSQLLNAAIPIPEAFLEGSATVACDQPVGMIGLHFELRPDGSIITFNTLPPGIIETASRSSDETAKSLHVVPHLADGGGWKSFLMVTNVSKASSPCTLQLYGLDMSRLEDSEGVTVTDSTASFELGGAGGYLVWSTRGEGPEASGYATLDCANPVVAQVVFASIGSSGAPTGMATVFSSQAATVFQFPVLMPEATLGFAIANNGNAETSCRIVLEDRQRTNLGEATVSVPAKSNRSQLLNAAIPIPEAFLEGSATVACDQSVGMIGLHFELRTDGSIITFNTLPNTVLDTNPQTEFTPAEDPFARWNDLEPQPWWRESEPYSCLQEEKLTSPWMNAGLVDLGGSDPLSLIRYFGNGSYLRYGNMGFFGCTPLDKYPTAFHQDAPADPAYYSLGDLHIWVDIARVPENASGWSQDDGQRVEFSMESAVGLLNQYVAPYFSRISQDNLRMVFHQGNEFTVEGEGRPEDAELQQFRLVGACLDECSNGAPGGLNRILLDDVASHTAGRAYNGWAAFGLASFRAGYMETIVHEMGHGWMAWPHSFSEVPWRPLPNSAIQAPQPYSNFFDIMSQLGPVPTRGWDHNMPSTLAINRYAAGWINPEQVALHLVDTATYTLSKPRGSGNQFLVVHSGRPYAFTTLEVLEERSDKYRADTQVYDPAVPGKYRPRRYEGVLVSRYDHSAGTGASSRVGPALYHKENPKFLEDVGWGRDDYSLIGDGETRDIGSGVKVEVTRNRDGSYAVTVSGGRVAEFERWCSGIWFAGNEYDTGCYLDYSRWE